MLSKNLETLKLMELKIINLSIDLETIRADVHSQPSQTGLDTKVKATLDHMHKILEVFQMSTRGLIEVSKWEIAQNSKDENRPNLTLDC